MRYSKEKIMIVGSRRMSASHPLLLLFSLLIVSLQALAKPEVVASVDSPNKVLSAALVLDEGRLAYRVTRLGQPIIADSRLGFLLQGAEKIERNLTLVSKAISSHDDTWEQPWGESRFVRNHYQQLRARFAESTRGKRFFDVIFRVYDDGVGFRYEFPEQANFSEMRIVDELTEFDVVPKATAWWIPAGEWNRYEYLYRRTPLVHVGQAHTPMTIRSNNGLHIAFHEAALVDYAAMWLRRVEGQKFRAELSRASDAFKVRRSLPFNTPWRTLQITDSAGALVHSNLILNLNEANKLGDVSWFRPSKYVGIWWSLHLDTESWNTGPKHGASTANAKKMIDFAADNGFRGVLIEGWNLGWDGDWFANGWNFDFTQATPDFDFKEVTRYAASRGVHIVGHHETACAVSHYERQLKAAFDLYAAAGVEQVKTGYVCDAGQIERQDKLGGPILREWHDGQWMSNHHLRVVLEAAKHKIAINAHEPIKDTGLRRTYPNWVAREGARGMEYNAWGSPPNPPEHEANLVFTRMLSGPMDFTPGVLSLKGRAGQAIESTLAKQLALYVVLYSPIQMVADLPEHYQAQLAAFQFIKDVPTDWAQTRVLNGEIGDFVTIARQDRNSQDWYLGALTDENGRVLDVGLDFLDPKLSYSAQIYRDGDKADYRHDATDHVIERKEVNSSQRLSLRLAAGGGVAIRFVAQARK
jgi:alpha-glucosidase